jgi:hypothetical protein
LDVKASDSIDKMKALIYDKNFALTFAGKQLKDGVKALSDYSIESESTVCESGRLVGGAIKGVKKTFSKKEGRTALVRKMRKGFAETIGIDEDEVESKQVPGKFDDVLRSIKERTEELCGLKKLDDRKFILKALGHMSEDDLKLLCEVVGRRGLKPEDRLTYMAQLIVPDMSLLEAMGSRLKRQNLDILASVADIYATRYTMIRGTELQFDNDAFKKHIEGFMQFRSGLQHSSSSAGADLEVEDVVEVEEASEVEEPIEGTASQCIVS